MLTVVSNSESLLMLPKFVMIMQRKSERINQLNLS